MTELLAACGIEHAFRRRGSLGFLHARPENSVLKGVNLSLKRGETLALVGESGSGKSTLARILVRLIVPTKGTVLYCGEDIASHDAPARRAYCRRVQMVFQDPFGSLNPSIPVGDMLAEPICVHRIRQPADIPGRVAELLDLVGLPANAAGRYPHAFSGGQRQRIAIARALALEPEVLIADEVVSALDVSVQAQILNLLLDLQDRLGLAILFVSHDLRVVRHIAHRVAVMHRGLIVETGANEVVFATPRHAYTRNLLAASPSLYDGNLGMAESNSCV